MAGAQHHVSLRGISHVFRDVAGGQFVWVTGPGGCGKPPLLRIAGGLLRPTSGEAWIGGAAPAAAQRRRDIGLVAQDAALLPWRTVLANVRLPLEIDHAARDRPAPSPEELLELTGLTEFRSYYPHQLSGGMQQRVAIARALAFDPSLLLMDEPFGALDEISRASMRYELLRIWQTAPSGRKTVMFVTHSIPEAIALSDRVVVLSPRPGGVRAAIDVELPRPRPRRRLRVLGVLGPVARHRHHRRAAAVRRLGAVRGGPGVLLAGGRLDAVRGDAGPAHGLRLRHRPGGRDGPLPPGGAGAVPAGDRDQGYAHRRRGAGAGHHVRLRPDAQDRRRRPALLLPDAGQRHDRLPRCEPRRPGVHALPARLALAALLEAARAQRPPLPVRRPQGHLPARPYRRRRRRVVHGRPWAGPGHLRGELQP